MRFTRNVLLNEVNNVFKFHKIYNKAILKASSKFWRGRLKISGNIQTLLTNIIFVFYSQHCHWAETDGTTIWINTYKDYTKSLLYYTLLHESLHYCATREDGSYISENLDHKIIQEISNELCLFFFVVFNK